MVKQFLDLFPGTKLMAPWLAKFLKRPTNKGRAVVKGKSVTEGLAMV